MIMHIDVKLFTDRLQPIFPLIIDNRQSIVQTGCPKSLFLENAEDSDHHRDKTDDI